MFFIIRSVLRVAIVSISLIFIAFGQQPSIDEIRKLIDNNNIDPKLFKDKISSGLLQESSEDQQLDGFDNLDVIIEQRDSESAVNQELFFEKNIMDNDAGKAKVIIDDEIEKNMDLNDGTPAGTITSNLTRNSNKQYFGYNFFIGGNEIFENTMDDAIDPDYLIGPGDQIILMLWGQTEFNKTFTVSREGYLFIDDIGQVFVNGLTLDKLQKKLFNLLKKVHSSLNPVSGNPSTFFDISLGSSVMKPKKIFVVGEVEKPGAYFTKQSTSLFTSLYYFNGPTINGSLRDIKLVRKGKDYKSIDYYDFLLFGKNTNDIRLIKDDVVFIPKRGKTVTTKGEIRRPGIYEIKESETLNDLIDISGGLLNTTYLKLIQINRIVDPSKRKILSADRVLIDVDLLSLNKNEKFNLVDGDIIEFFKISDQIARSVIINGAVKRPGVYSYYKGMKVKDLVSKADGILGTTYKQKAEITRINNDNSQTLINLNLSAALNNDPDNNIILNENDAIEIFDFQEMLFKNNVEIVGHVENPGVKIFKKDMNLFDLIFSGGGFENEEHLKNTYFEKAILIRNVNESFEKIQIPFRLDSVLAGMGLANEKLKMGDKVRIYSINEIEGITPNTVSIGGKVKIPGVYDKTDGMRLSDLLFLGGGFYDAAYLSNVFRARADIIRIEEDYISKEIISFSLNDIINDPNSPENILLKAGDAVTIYDASLFRYGNSVSIEGEIAKPGLYELKNNMKLTDLILEAGGIINGINSFVFEIARLDDNNFDEKNYSEIISGELKNTESTYLNTGNKINTVLRRNDIVFIRRSMDNQKQMRVSISGEVYYPGDYVLSNADEKVTDVISRAGGLKPFAYPFSSKLIRNNEEIKLSFNEVIKRPKSKSNLKLAPGDQIIIGTKPGLVKISGAVNSPGNYQFIKNKRFNDYVKLAGGYTKDASRLASYVVLPNGTSKKIKLLSISQKLLMVQIL